MADKKITELTGYTPPIDTDVAPIVDITTTTTKKITWANIKAALKTYFDSLSTTLTNKTLTSPLFDGTIDGWISTGTFTYASATTITVASGAASIYQIGYKLRFKQTAGTYCYYYVTVVADTLLTVATSTTFTVLNQSITVPAYSHASSPLGFPQWLATAAPTFDVTYYDNGSGGQPTTTESRFAINGRTCTAHYRGNGTKAGANIYIIITTFPFPAPVNSTTSTAIGIGYINNSVTEFPAVFTSNYLLCSATSLADNAVLAHVSFTITYEI